MVALSRRGVSTTGGDVEFAAGYHRKNTGVFWDVFPVSVPIISFAFTCLGTLRHDRLFLVAFRSLVGGIVQVFSRSCSVGFVRFASTVRSSSHIGSDAVPVAVCCFSFDVQFVVLATKWVHAASSTHAIQRHQHRRVLVAVLLQLVLSWF